jgi:hypothetical protein
VNNTYYAFGKIGGMVVLMHQLIIHPVDGKVTDHRNRNGLVNTETNLRLVDYATNARNTKRRKNIGVTWDKRRKKWRADLKVDKKLKFLGYFKKESDASRRYKDERSKHFEKDGTKKENR